MTLLDTNTVIHYLKGVAAVVERFHDSSPRELALPSVVAYELEYGCRSLGSARRRAIVAGLLATLQQIPLDHAAAREAARIRIGLEARGRSIGPVDVLIAGTAVSRGAVLVTNNTREFSRIEGLRLEDWTR